MPADQKSVYSPATSGYVFGVVLCGTAAVAIALVQLFNLFALIPSYRNQWLMLVGLTVLSGLLPVTLSVRTAHVGISVSETFVIAGTLLFGRPGGTILVLLDALLISLYLLWSRGLRWQPLLFNLTAPPLSISLATWLTGLTPQFRTEPSFDAGFVVQLTLFTTLYFVLNTGLVTVAMAIKQRVSPLNVWWTHFRELLLNYTAGGSIAALLVYNTREVKPEFLFAIAPLLTVLFLTYQWSNKRVQIERERNTELNRVFLSTVEALALAIDAKDQVTHGHIRRVQRYTVALARSLGVSDNSQLDAIRAAALLHDTGKLAVPEYILNKPGPLTPAEFDRMKVHASVGADILKSIGFPYPVEPIVRHHHENWNGSGYPDGLCGQEIPLGARILSVVDCYDALTSDRPYRPRFTRQHAEQVLRDRRGSWYDPWIVDDFLRILTDLEREDAEDERASAQYLSSSLVPAQLEVITATTAEEREFGELRRELPLATTLVDAGGVIFRHLRRVMPLSNVTVFVPITGTSEIRVAVTLGSGTTALEGLQIVTGERISGWVMAHRQTVINSNAALDLGPIARTLAPPLRYALATPILGPRDVVIGILTCYSAEAFQTDHRRVIENAATLLGQSEALAALGREDIDHRSLGAVSVH